MVAVEDLVGFPDKVLDVLLEVLVALRLMQTRILAALFGALRRSREGDF